MVTGGTGETRTTHSSLAPVGFMMSMALAALPAIWGVLTLGLGAIDWWSAIVWGAVATIAFTLFMMMGKAMGMSRMDLLDLLGSNFARPKSRTSRMVGGSIHLMNGALLGVAWAYAARLAGADPGVGNALAWSVVLWLLALLMLSTMGAVHPAIRRGEQEDPGPAATNFGKMTPVGSFLGHLVYGAVLGLGYVSFPLG